MRRRLNWLVATVTVVTCALMTAACGSDSGAQQGKKAQSSSLVHDGFISVSKHEDEAFFPDAEMHGALILKDGCLLVDDHVAVFTADFTWDATSKTLTWPQGSATVGDKVAFGGGVETRGSEETDPLISTAARDEIKRCIEATGAADFSYMTNA